ncbi:MAG: EAL domain-containing protein, partial [Nevskia sp.]|nr:EAL domain-containing protein [Nevskia sp.]
MTMPPHVLSNLDAAGAAAPARSHAGASVEALRAAARPASPPPAEGTSAGPEQTQAGDAGALQFIVGLSLPLAGAILQWQLWPLIRPEPWLLSYPAVFLASWIGGRTSGRLATLVSVALIWWPFLLPERAFAKGLSAYLSSAIFLAMGTLLSEFHGRLRRALRRAAAAVAALRHSNDELSRSRRRFGDLIDLAPDGVFIADLAGRYIEVNSAGCRMLGYSREELLRKTIVDLIPPEDVDRLWSVARRLAEGGTDMAEWQLRHSNGRFVPCEISTVILPDGRWQAVVRDITMRKHLENELRQAAIVFQNTNEGILITDAAANIVSVNAAFESISGFSRTEVIGRNPRMQKSGRQDKAFYRALWDSLNATGQWQGEVWNRRKDGSLYPAWQNISAVKDAHGKVTNYVSVIADIGAVKQAEAKLAHLAHHDVLTGLPNRLKMESALEASLERARRHGYKLAVLFIDLDHFKLVNDSMGHAAGDRLLREVGSRILRCIRGEDTVARLGGDEFTVVLESIGHPDDAAHVAEKIVEAVRQPITVDGRSLTSSASVGISIYPDDGKTAEALTRNADAALYRAKDRGRNSCQFYSPELTAKATARLAMEHDLRRALARDELVLHYQPQYDVVSGRLSGLEALLRWNDPELGLVMPDRFIPIAEESQLIEALGDRVIDEACRQARAWLDAGLRPVRTAINVSGRQILHDHLAEKVEAALAANRITASEAQLEIEVTETVLLSIKPSRQVLERLRALGVKIVVDDFGTGYSSLNTLRHLPVDAIKIAQVFMSGVPNDPDSNAIVSAV